MSHSLGRFSGSFAVAFVVVMVLLYLILTSQIAVALMPALGAGGLYAEASFLEAQQGTVYPEYQGGQSLVDFDAYEVDITTTVPACGDDGIPMLVLDLDGEARAVGFEFRKDLQLPFADERWMVIEIREPPVTISGDNLKIFTTQMAGSYLEIKNARVIEGGIEDMDEESNTQWGPDSDQFVIKGGMDTGGNVPGLRAQDVQAWMHGATGERVTLETPPQARINIDISYQTTQEVRGFYTGDAGPGTDPKLGFDLQDQNIDFQDDSDEEDRRVRRSFDGGFFGEEGYFTCSDVGGVTY